MAITSYDEFLRGGARPNGPDIAYTLALRRERLPHRSFSIVQDGDIIGSWESATVAAAKPAPVYMAFTGQGAHWAGMAKEMVLGDDLFRKDIALMDSILSGLTHPPSWSMMGKRSLLSFVQRKQS